jgi:lipopolysaccharide/colanic/teichoic acid biosynthesis glycosyltransferase
LTALAIKLSDWRHPVLYSQLRVGQFGRPFRIYKFRTMRVDAERESGAVWASAGDPRITRLGRFLRATRLDEIPQFWNVLVGNMSVVGPRPERPEMVARLVEQIPYYSERENVPPGLTGWAQIRHPYGSSVEDARRKLEFDLYYIKHMSVSLDLQILLSTVRIVLFGQERTV